MKWLDKLERKLGHVGIKGLMNYIVGLNLGVFLLVKIGFTNITDMLVLIPSLVLKGEVWRLITYLFIPPTFSPLWLLFTLYFYYMIGSTLEHEWGTFKFNIYYLIGTIGVTLVSFITGAAAVPLFLNLSLILAFAYIYPNFQILLFFILPVKIKYLAWLYMAYLVYGLLGSPLYGILIIVASMLNFVVFFGKDIFIRLRTGRQTYYRRKSYNAKLTKDFTIHKCEVCQKTEKDDKDMEFRYCVKCEGDHEYCMEHLNSHEHITF